MAGPLEGLRILDLATVVAGPLASTLLADLGAHVVKAELPDGRDGLRHLPPHKDGVPLWWKVGNRNKKGVTLDVRTKEGRELLLRMLPDFDVLVENFRTGTMDKWGLDAATLWKANPRLTILRVTGFGQTGPYRARPGFARIFDAMSGFTSLNGPHGGGPMNLGYPLSDAVAGLFGAIGILSAAFHRLRNPDSPGQEIDVAATESMFRVLDFLAVEYDQLGVVRERLGNLSAYSAPSNIYATRDGKWLSMAVSVQSIFERLAQAIERPDLPADPRYADNRARVANRDTLDKEIADWMAARDLGVVAEVLTRHEITFSPVYSIKDVFEDPHFRERQMIVGVPDSALGTLRMQNVVPRFSRTPGGVQSTGPDLGQDNEEVYGRLGLDADKLRDLRARGVI
jgi:crotonobetainyl-CoA:carnitine CoA-transferase CaiB-like acyl-CoA transferase